MIVMVKGDQIATETKLCFCTDRGTKTTYTNLGKSVCGVLSKSKKFLLALDIIE